MGPISSAILLIFLSAGLVYGQADHPGASEAVAGSPDAIPLEVPAGTPLPVVLDKEVRIRKAGQPIHGKIAEPVYAFDKLVVPAGSEVTGSVTSIARVPALKRTHCRARRKFLPYPRRRRYLRSISCCPTAAASRFTRKFLPPLKEFCNSRPRPNPKTKTKKAKKTQP